MNEDRRTEPGLAIVTQRPLVLEQACRELSIPVRTLLVQPGPDWPLHRPPILLDTVGLKQNVLLALLSHPPRAAPDAASHSFAVLVEPHKLLTLRLLRCCAAVQLVCGPELTALREVLGHIWPMQPPAQVVVPPLWLLSPPPPLPLDPLLLPALWALHEVWTYAEAAELCGISERTLLRLLMEIRTVLGLPTKKGERLRPPILAEMILARLADERLEVTSDGSVRAVLRNFGRHIPGRS